MLEKYGVWVAIVILVLIFVGAGLSATDENSPSTLSVGNTEGEPVNSTESGNDNTALLASDATPVAPPIEIVQWGFYLDPDFGYDGAVIWQGEVKNNTDDYVETVWLQATFYDANGKITDTDQTVVTGLAPGAKKSFKGYATYFGTETTGQCVVDRYY